MLRHILIALILLAGLTPAQAAPLRLTVETAKVVVDPLSGFNQLEVILTPPPASRTWQHSPPPMSAGQ